VLFIVIIVIMGRMMVASHLLVKEVGLGTEEDGNRDSSNSKEEVLHTSLALVHGLFDNSRSQSNVNQGSNEVGRLASVTTTSKVQGAHILSGVIALAFISPRGAGSVSSTATVNPNTSLAIDSLLIVNASPSIRGGVQAGGTQHA